MMGNYQQRRQLRALITFVNLPPKLFSMVMMTKGTRTETKMTLDTKLLYFFKINSYGMLSLFWGCEENRFLRLIIHFCFLKMKKKV